MANKKETLTAGTETVSKEVKVKKAHMATDASRESKSSQERQREYLEQTLNDKMISEVAALKKLEGQALKEYKADVEFARDRLITEALKEKRSGQALAGLMLDDKKMDAVMDEAMEDVRAEEAYERLMQKYIHSSDMEAQQLLSDSKKVLEDKNYGTDAKKVHRVFQEDVKAGRIENKKLGDLFDESLEEVAVAHEATEAMQEIWKENMKLAKAEIISEALKEKNPTEALKVIMHDKERLEEFFAARIDREKAEAEKEKAIKNAVEMSKAATSLPEIGEVRGAKIAKKAEVSIPAKAGETVSARKPKRGIFSKLKSWFRR